MVIKWIYPVYNFIQKWKWNLFYLYEKLTLKLSFPQIYSLFFNDSDLLFTISIFLGKCKKQRSSLPGINEETELEQGNFLRH